MSGYSDYQLVFANVATTVLADGITDTATSGVLSAGTGSEFPTLAANQAFIGTLVDPDDSSIREVVLVIGRSGDTITSMLRAQEGTTALAWSAGALFQNRNTMGAMSAMAQLYSLAKSTGATLVNYILGLPNAVSRTVSAKLQEVPSILDFNVTPDGTTLNRTQLNNAMAAGSGGRTLDLLFPASAGNVKVEGTINIAGNFSTHLHGASWPGCQLNFSQMDGSDCFYVAPRATDGAPVYFSKFALNANGQAGHGFNVDGGVGGEAPYWGDVLAKGNYAAGKAAIKANKSYTTGNMERTWVWSWDIGLLGTSINGWSGRDLWFADNNLAASLDKNCSGNSLEFTEMGLSAVDLTKKAIFDDGNNNLWSFKFYENLGSATACWLGPNSFGVVIDGQSLAFFNVFDQGWLNKKKIGNNIPLFDLEGSWDYAGPQEGSAWDLENQYTDSQFLNSVGLVHWHGYGATPCAGFSVNTSWGFPWGNSLQLDWGTTSQSGAQSDNTYPVVAGDWFVCVHALQLSRDQASDEKMFIQVLGGSGQDRGSSPMPGGMKQGQIYFVAVAQKMVASENVSLRIGLQQDVNSAHAALLSSHSGFTVMKNKRFFTILPSPDTATRTLQAAGSYRAVANLGVANLEISPSRFAQAIGVAYKTNTPVDSPNSTANTLANRYAVGAFEMYTLDSGMKIHYRGRTDVTMNTKRVSIEVNGVVVFDTGLLVSNGLGWNIWVDVSRFDTGSLSVHAFGFFGGSYIDDTDQFVEAAQKTPFNIDCYLQNGVARPADVSLYGARFETY